MAITIHEMIGRNPQTIAWWQMASRAVLVFVYLLALVRVGMRRVFGRFTSFDIVIAILLGSILSRALTATVPLGPAFVASAVLVALHWSIARLAFWKRGLSWLIAPSVHPDERRFSVA